MFDTARSPLTVQSNLLVASAPTTAAAGRNGRVAGRRRPSTVDLWAVQFGGETLAFGPASQLKSGEYC